MQQACIRLIKGLSPKRLKLTEMSTFYKHFLHPRLVTVQLRYIGTNIYA